MLSRQVASIRAPRHKQQYLFDNDLAEVFGRVQYTFSLMSMFLVCYQLPGHWPLGGPGAAMVCVTGIYQKERKKEKQSTLQTRFVLTALPFTEALRRECAQHILACQICVACVFCSRMIFSEPLTEHRRAGQSISLFYRITDVGRRAQFCILDLYYLFCSRIVATQALRGK